MRKRRKKRNNREEKKRSKEKRKRKGCTWWWLPLPLEKTSMPLRAKKMCGAAGVNSSSHVSGAKAKSLHGRQQLEGTQQLQRAANPYIATGT